MSVRLKRNARLGKYRLESRLGQGAFAEVWKARDTVEHRPVALKVALPHAVAQWGRERIAHEARIASRLSHPNVVSIRNADWLDGHFVIATDLAQRNLEKYPGARRSSRIALQVIRDAACGLAYAHSQRILHRDVKPENILIFPDGRAALGDFGVSKFAARATQTYTEAGTLGYMAPEQAYGKPRYASDVFSLGLIAYELLTGTLPTWPFTWPPPGYERFRAKVPEPVQGVLRRAAAFHPSRRYPDAVAFHDSLTTAFRASASRNRPRRAADRQHRPRRSKAPSPLAAQWESFHRAHGRALDMRYGCVRCGGPIAEAMRFCPWCGEKGNSFAELTSYPLICPWCERGVRPEWNACPWCFPGRFQSNGRRPPPDLRALRRCSRRGCEGQLRRFMRYCPLCKQKVRRPWSTRELEDRCPRCRGPVSRSFWHFCPWCSRREPRAGQF